MVRVYSVSLEASETRLAIYRYPQTSPAHLMVARRREIAGNRFSRVYVFTNRPSTGRFPDDLRAH